MARELTEFELEHIDVLANDFRKNIVRIVGRYRPMETDEVIVLRGDISISRVAPEN